MFTCTHFLAGTGSGMVATEQMGFKSKYCFSFKPLEYRDKYYDHNFKEPKLQFLPLELVETDNFDTDHYDKFKKYIVDNNIESTDFQISIPCCKGLSLLSRISKSDSLDNLWMVRTVEWFFAQNNDILIFENSRDLMENKGKLVKEKIIERFNKYNEKNEYKMLFIKTKGYIHNSPQSRTRAFCIIYKSKYAYHLNKIHDTIVNVKDVLNRPEQYDESIPYHFYPLVTRNLYKEFLQYIEDKNLWDMCRNYAKEHEDSRFSLLSLYAGNTVEQNLKQFEGYPEICKYISSNQPRCEREGKVMYDSSPIFYHKHCKTINGRNSYLLIHPKYNRYLSLREYMDIQGLPDTYSFPEKSTIHDKCSCVFRMVPIQMMTDFLKYMISIKTGKEDIVTRIQNNSSIIYQNLTLRKNGQIFSEKFEVIQ